MGATTENSPWYERAAALGWPPGVITRDTRYWVELGWRVVIVSRACIVVKHPVENHVLVSYAEESAECIRTARREIEEWRVSSGLAAATSKSSWGDLLKT